jgi:predicted dinucleotide-utilizing enzyme
MAAKRIGIVGFGYIGRYVYEQILARPELGLEAAFVVNRTAEKLAALPAEVVLADLGDFASRSPDLVVEMAHPAVTAAHGAAILERCDYMMLSVTALADAELERRLLDICAAHGTRLFIPHGALIGVDNLYEARANWREVTITFRKHPMNIDFSESGIDPESVTGETVLYDGPVRGIAGKFPRNVNTMATCALASVGLDACRAVLVADPALDVAIAEVVALGADGARFETRKVEPAIGVSGTGMLASQLASICRAAGHEPGLNFV